MVVSITNSDVNGLYELMIRRVVAVIIFFYTMFIIGFLFTSPDLSFDLWQSLFENSAMRILALLVVVLFAAQAWISLWYATIDYMSNDRSSFCRSSRRGFSGLSVCYLSYPNYLGYKNR